MSQPNLADWLTRLEGFSPHEIDLGLERVARVLDKLEIRFPTTVLHVAGTNGKGSSVAMLQSLLGAYGLKTGAYTSPHVFRFNERIQIAGTEASNAEIVDAFERVESVRNDIPLTYFEFATLAALLVFEAQQVDAVILEVGMGGRLDAVNAVEPTAGIITNVSLDHCDWLGNDVEAIASEKAGIMRRDKPIVFASPEIPAAIEHRASDIGARLIVAGRDYRWTSGDDRWHWSGQSCKLDGLLPPGLTGSMQLQNAAGALALLEAAGFVHLLERDIVNQGLRKLGLSGRMQSVVSDRHWLVDVAHNPAAASALADTLDSDDFTAQTVAIVGMLDDKDVAGLVSPLSRHVDKWIAVPAQNPRTYALDELARRIANATNKACLEAGSIAEAIEHARSATAKNDRVLVTGSFYVVGPALEALGLYSPRKDAS